MASDYFLRLDGIEGESQDSTHAKQITIYSFSWGASQTSSVAGTGGSGAGKASLSDISFMIKFDKSSPLLFKSLLKGTHIATGTLTANKAAGNDTGAAFIKVDFTELFVTSLQLSGSSGGDEVPSVSLSMSYNTIKIDYLMQNEKGILTSTGPVSYDLKTNKQS